MLKPPATTGEADTATPASKTTAASDGFGGKTKPSASRSVERVDHDGERRSQSSRRHSPRSSFSATRATAAEKDRKEPLRKGVADSSGASRVVHVSVADATHNRVKDFQVEVELLRRSMPYFAPAIVKAEKRAEAEAAAEGDSHPGARSGSLRLRVNCDIGVFEWLLAHVQGEAQPMTCANVASIVVSSQFLQMQELFEKALHFLRDNLHTVVTSSVNMSCISGVTAEKLSLLVTEETLARCYLEMYNKSMNSTGNRVFLSDLLRGVASRKKRPASTVKSTASVASHCAVSAARGSILAEGGGELPLTGAESFSGVSWCRTCGVLLNFTEMHRRAAMGQPSGNLQGSLPVTLPVCKGLSKTNPKQLGPRGEVLLTHTASANSEVRLKTPPASDKNLEQWCWRVIGASHFRVCRRCRCLVPLLEAPLHGCPGGRQNFVSGGAHPDDPNEGSDALTAFIFLAHSLRIYAPDTPAERPSEVSTPPDSVALYFGLSPIYHPSATTLAAELIPNELYVADANASAEGSRAPPSSYGSPRETNYYFLNKDITMVSSTNLKWKGGGRHYIMSQPKCGTWASYPFVIREVVDVDGTPNIELQYFYERQLIAEQQELHRVLCTEPFATPYHALLSKNAGQSLPSNIVNYERQLTGCTLEMGKSAGSGTLFSRIPSAARSVDTLGSGAAPRYGKEKRFAGFSRRSPGGGPSLSFAASAYKRSSETVSGTSSGTQRTAQREFLPANQAPLKNTLLRGSASPAAKKTQSVGHLTRPGLLLSSNSRPAPSLISGLRESPGISRVAAARKRPALLASTEGPSQRSGEARQSSVHRPSVKGSVEATA